MPFINRLPIELLWITFCFPVLDVAMRMSFRYLAARLVMFAPVEYHRRFYPKTVDSRSQFRFHSSPLDSPIRDIAHRHAAVRLSMITRTQSSYYVAA